MSQTYLLLRYTTPLPPIQHSFQTQPFFILHYNGTFTYSHPGLHETVVLTPWLPSPDDIQNRYQTTGEIWYQLCSLCYRIELSLVQRTPYLVYSKRMRSLHSWL